MTWAISTTILTLQRLLILPKITGKTGPQWISRTLTYMVIFGLDWKTSKGCAKLRNGVLGLDKNDKWGTTGFKIGALTFSHICE